METPCDRTQEQYEATLSQSATDAGAGELSVRCLECLPEGARLLVFCLPPNAQETSQELKAALADPESALAAELGADAVVETVADTTEGPAGEECFLTPALEYLEPIGLDMSSWSKSQCTAYSSGMIAGAVLLLALLAYICARCCGCCGYGRCCKKKTKLTPQYELEIYQDGDDGDMQMDEFRLPDGYEEGGIMLDDSGLESGPGLYQENY